MKKFLSLVFIFSFIFAGNTQYVFADITTAPVVSIGVGNGNIPANTGPTHGSVYNGEIPVFATITDDDLDNYHFRVVKDGGIDGYTCLELGALFAPENQGHASSTLAKDACGFVYNLSVYSAPTGFTNTQIATLNTADIIAYSGEGDYWLILGAVDTAGNRTNSNWLNDQRIKITVSSTPVTPVVIPTPTVTTTSSSSGGSGGNGPIVGTYGVVNSGYVGGSTSGSNGTSAGNTSSNLPITDNQGSSMTEIASDSGLILPSDEVENTETDVNTDVVTNSADENKEVKNTASAFLSGFNLNWLWLLLLIVILGGGYYFNKKNSK